MAVYYGDWADYAAVRGDYADLPPETDLVYAGYTYEDYSGSAIVVYVRGGDLWENHDGHCSCNGLDNWSPEKTTAAAILMRPVDQWPGLADALVAWVTGVMAERVGAPMLVSKSRAVRLRH